MYNTTPHSVTGKAPLELLTGRPVKDLLPSLRTDPNWKRDEQVRERDAIKKMQAKLYADERRRAKQSDISTGDVVMMKSYDYGKLEPNFKLEKFTVINRSGNDTLIVNKDGIKYRRPVVHLKKWPSSSSSHSTSSSSKCLDKPVGQNSAYSFMKRKESQKGNDFEPPQQRIKNQENDDHSTRERPIRIQKIPKRYS